MSRRILVTGSAGFVGSHLVDHLLAKTDWDIVGLDSFRHRGDSLRVQKSERYQIHALDLSSPISPRVLDLIGPVDYIVNMASESHVDRSITDPVPFVQNNVNLALYVLEAARVLKPKHFIQISTDEVYGPALEGIDHKEWDRILPSNPYCVHPDSVVETPSGRRKISELKEGDEVLGYCRGELAFRPVAAVMGRTTDEEFLRVKHKYGNLLTSKDHRFMIVRPNRGSDGSLDRAKITEPVECRAADLRPGDWLVLNRTVLRRATDSSISEARARLFGFFVGNGNLKYLASHRRKSLQFCSGYQHLVEKYATSFRDEFGLQGTVYKHSSKECWYFQAGAAKVWDTFEQFGSGAQNKQCVAALDWDEPQVAAYLGGLFDADGSYNDTSKCISISTISPVLAHQLLYLFKRIGCLASVSSALRGKGKRRCYRVTVTDSKSKMTFVEKCKPAKYPITIESESQMTMLRDDVVYVPFKGYDLIENDVGRMIDIEVEDSHNFFCDGVLVHNSASKAAQEAIAISYWRTYGLPLTITNCMNMIGERQDPEKFVPLVISKVLKGETVTVHGSEKYIGKRKYLHSRNLADALLYLLKFPYVNQYSDSITADQTPTRFNIVGDVELNNLEMAQMIAKFVGKELRYELVDFHALTTRPGHDRRYSLDGTKLARLGWRAPVEFEESLRRTVEWYLQNPAWLK